MLDALSSFIAFIIAIGVLVTVHEFGHYIVGRWCGMRVLRFSIGFGKPLWTRIGAAPDRTEYCVAAIPLGGYVRFLDSREAEIAPQDAGRAFDHRPVPQRIAVLLAGPAFNFVFAIVAYWGLFVYGVPTPLPAIGDVEPGSPAAAAGLEHGDRILAVGDRQTEDWESALVAILSQVVADGEVTLRLSDTAGRERTAVLDVGEDTQRLTEPGLLFEGLGFEPWQPPAVVGEVAAGGAAAAAGIQSGDRIVAIDDEPVRGFAGLQNAVSGRPGEAVVVDVDRGGEALSFDVVLDTYEEDGGAVGRLGVGAVASVQGYFHNRQYGPLESVARATERTWASTAFTVNMLGRMLVGDVSIKNISGPINIAQFAGASVQAGLERFIDFLAIVSISLGVLNLIPVPVLDGGQIVYQLIELAKGSPLSERAQLLGQQVGIFALLLIMSFAFYNDIARLLG
ncbi:MAG TPA: RIP metalloprotease RseP [Woeseiaceae bacterium]|nr:RIP metalloprotease RseP [Woeseiaceae bacterium]